MNNFALDNFRITQFNWKSPIHFVIALSLVGWLALWAFPTLLIYGGIYAYPVGFFGFIGELLLYSFLHGGLWHFLSNALFFLTIGRIIEITYGFKNTWFLWIWTTLFVGVFLFLFSDTPTIGGSGFALSLLTVYAYDLYHQRHSDFKGALLLIALNLVIGLSVEISFMGHFAGAIAGFIFAWWFHRKEHKTVRS